MNSIQIMGRITNDLELKSTSETCVLNFTVAVNRTFKKEGQPDADFFNCTAFGKTAETIAKYHEKGHRIAVEGSIQFSSYEKEGLKINKTSLIVGKFHFCQDKNEI